MQRHHDGHRQKNVEFREVAHMHRANLHVNGLSPSTDWGGGGATGLLPLSAGIPGRGKYVLKGDVNICAKLGANTHDAGVSSMS